MRYPSYLFLFIVLLFGVYPVSTLSSSSPVSPSVVVEVPISATDIISRVNIERSAYGLKALVVQSALTKAAELKVRDIASKGALEHTVSSPGVLWWPLVSVQYSYESVGENLAEGTNNAEEIVLQWMNSPKHRLNIMNTEYTDIGVAITKGMYNSEEVSFVVLYVAKPKTIAPITQPVGVSVSDQKIQLIRQLIIILTQYLNILIAQQ